MPLKPTIVPPAPRVPEPPAYVPAAAPPAAPPPAGLRARLRARRAGAPGAAFGRGVVVEVAAGARLEIAAGAAIGDGCRILVRGGVVRIGPGVVVGERCRLVAHAGVEIGERAVLGDEVVVLDFDHRYDDPERPVRLQGLVSAPVRIGAGARIGARAAIQRGATIAEGGEVGAGTSVGGVPALRPPARPGTPGGSRSRPAR